MQIKKAGVVAAGALATVAVMGAPAAAGPAPQADASAFTKASALNMARHGWSNPWDSTRQGLLWVGTGSVVNAAAWQICGSSAVAGVGVTVDVDPNTVIGGYEGACNNGNVLLDTQKDTPLIGLANDSSVSVATWQACGSTLVGGLLVTASLQAPNTVFGDCRNGNVMITSPEESGHVTESTTVDKAEKGNNKAAGITRQGDTSKLRDAFAGDNRKADKKAGKAKSAKADARGGGSNPWDIEPMGLLTAASGSAVQLATWQLCGGSAVWGLGVVAQVSSPSTVFGDCDNANVWIDQPEWPHSLISVLDHSSVNLLPWQVCGSDTVAGVGVTASVTSPDTVIGTCSNANTVIK